MVILIFAGKLIGNCIWGVGNWIIKGRDWSIYIYIYMYISDTGLFEDGKRWSMDLLLHPIFRQTHMIKQHYFCEVS